VPVRFTSRAHADLRGIAAYTLEKWGRDQCARYLDALEARCRQMADVPQLRVHSPDVPSYYRALAGSHAIFYRVEKDDSIVVVRILHGAMLPGLHVPGSEDDAEER
jgi:toxin ParE1/3/4